MMPLTGELWSSFERPSLFRVQDTRNGVLPIVKARRR